MPSNSNKRWIMSSSVWGSEHSSRLDLIREKAWRCDKKGRQFQSEGVGRWEWMSKGRYNRQPSSKLWLENLCETIKKQFLGKILDALCYTFWLLLSGALLCSNTGNDRILEDYFFKSCWLKEIDTEFYRCRPIKLSIESVVMKMLCFFKNKFIQFQTHSRTLSSFHWI